MTDPTSTRKHNHYYRACPYKVVDFYRVASMFEVNHPAAQHVMKKLFAVGKRGHKDVDRDIQDMIDTLVRWQEMRAEEAAVAPKAELILDLTPIVLRGHGGCGINKI